MYYTIRGTLDILAMDIYINDNSVVKIISLKEVEDSSRMKMDNKEYHTMLVHYREDKTYRFK